MLDHEVEEKKKIIEGAQKNALNTFSVLDAKDIEPITTEKLVDFFKRASENLDTRAATLKVELGRVINESAQKSIEQELKEQEKIKETIKDCAKSTSDANLRIRTYFKAINDNVDKSLKNSRKSISEIFKEEHSKSFKKLNMQRDAFMKEIQKVKDQAARSTLLQRVEIRFDEIEKKMQEEHNKTMRALALDSDKGQYLMSEKFLNEDKMKIMSDRILKNLACFPGIPPKETRKSDVLFSNGPQAGDKLFDKSQAEVNAVKNGNLLGT